MISMVIVTLRLIFCSAAGYAFARIVLPLATPFLLGYGVLQFQGAWNDFMWPNFIGGIALSGLKER